MNPTNPQVDLFLEKAKKWQEEMTLMREILLECGLTEDYKWMHPCYTFQGNNVVLIHGFKEYCALLFHKGALLKDSDKILVQQTENVQSARQIRFSNLIEIQQLKSSIKAYVFEAIEVEKLGLEVPLKMTSEYPMPEELQLKFNETPGLESDFKALTPGRQRGYLLYFSQAKQSKTRSLRIKNCLPKIKAGLGLND